MTPLSVDLLPAAVHCSHASRSMGEKLSLSLYFSLTLLVLGYNQTLRSWNWTQHHLSQCAFRPLYAHPSTIFTLCCSVEAQDWCDRNEQASKVMAHCSSGKEMSASFVTWMTFTLCVCCGVVTGLIGKQALRGSVCCLFCCRMLFIEQSGKFTGCISSFLFRPSSVGYH